MSAEEGSNYSSLLQNSIWPPPNEATQARLQRLRELEEQRREHDATTRSPPPRTRRFASSEPIRRSRGERTGQNTDTENKDSVDNVSESKSGDSENVTSQTKSSRPLLRSRSEDSETVSDAASRLDAAIGDVDDDRKAIFDRIKELEEKRKLASSSSGGDSTNGTTSETTSTDRPGSARERFLQAYNQRSSVVNTGREQNRTEQIRTSRLRRRQERSRGGRYSSLTGLDHLRSTIGQGISEEGPEMDISVRGSRESSLTRRSAIETCTEAFSTLFPVERGIQRVEELEKLRKRTLQDFDIQNSEERLQRSHSLHSDNLPSNYLLNRYGSVDSATSSVHTVHTEPIIYGRQLTRSASSDRLMHLREELNLSQHSTYTSSSTGSSFIPSILPDIPSSPLHSSETSNVSTPAMNETATVDETDSLPVYMEGSVQGMPYVDSSGLTHWLGPTSPKYKELSSANAIATRRRSRDIAIIGSGFVDGASRREAYSTSMFPDHFLAPCFEKKYTFEERCELIRKQIYESDIGKSILAKMEERSPPDGESKEAENTDSNENAMNTENEIVASDEQVRES